MYDKSSFFDTRAEAEKVMMVSLYCRISSSMPSYTYQSARWNDEMFYCASMHICFGGRAFLFCLPIGGASPTVTWKHRQDSDGSRERGHPCKGKQQKRLSLIG